MKPTPLLLAILLCAGTVHAQKWPEKPVRLVVPYPPGGNVDVAARIVAPGLQEAFGQSFVVDNRAGAGGMIAGEAVAKAPADGYTLFFTANGPLLFSPVIFGRAAYHWQKDFAAVSSVSFTPLVLQVHPSIPARTLKEFLALAKRSPGTLAMASPGAGTTNHLVSELLQGSAGVSWTTAHYKGNAPATTDLIGGHVHFNFDQVSVALPYVRQGRTRALAVTTEARVGSLPEVPTFAEAGVPGMEASTFTGVVAPAGTPKDVVARLAAALDKVLREQSVVDRFAALGADARASTPEAFHEHLRREDAKWIPVIRRANIRAD